MKKLIPFLFILTLVIVSCQKNRLPVQSSSKKVKYKSKADSLYQKGRKYLSAVKDSTFIIADELIKLGEEHKDTLIIINGKLLKARYEWRLSNYPVAMKVAVEALALAQKKNLKNKLPGIYSAIGNIYKENEDYLNALNAAEKALTAARYTKDTLLIIGAMLNRAMFTHSYSMLKDDPVLEKRSLQLYQEGLQLAKSNSKFEKEEIAFYDNISQYYKLTHDYEKGIYYGKKGVALAKKYDQPRSLTYSYNWLGEIYYYQGYHKKGIAYLDSAIVLARSLNSSYRESEILHSKYLCYLSTGNSKEALAAYTRSTGIYDSLQILQNVRQIGQLQIQYETGRKDQKIATLGAINKEKTKESILISIALLIFFILCIFLLFQYRSIRHRNKLLTKSNQTINEQSQQLQLLMKELHHRVKNNLQIVSSLLSLQSNHLADREAQQAVKIGQQRIEAMSLIHRSLYRQENPNMVNMKEYITCLVESILQTFGIEKENFDLNIEIDLEGMDVDKALPLGLIINEWVTNAFKYAYKDVIHPSLKVFLKKDQNILLEIKDNGPGMSDTAWEKPTNSFGVKLVKVLSKQLKGNCRMQQDGGTKFTLQMPV